MMNILKNSKSTHIASKTRIVCFDANCKQMLLYKYRILYRPIKMLITKAISASGPTTCIELCLNVSLTIFNIEHKS